MNDLVERICRGEPVNTWDIDRFGGSARGGIYDKLIIQHNIHCYKYLVY